MSTLIAVYTSEGCIGRCDAKCYNAENEECDCICHGRNHGKGKRQAVENTRELAKDWVEEYAHQKQLAHGHYEAVIGAVVLPDLFGVNAAIGV